MTLNRTMTRPTRPALERDIFLTGDYIQHFNPDDEHNPFSNIYDQKRRDTINIVNKSQTPKTILDVGGGMGRISLALAESPQNRVILTDISIDMLRLAVTQAGSLRNLQVVKADAHDLPFKDNSFDHLVGLDLFCHIKKPKKALHEFHRVLASDGTLILDSTNSNPLWALFYPRYLGKNPLNWFRVMKFKGVYPGWEKIVKHYAKKTFFSFLYKAGFEVIKTLDYGPSVCPKWHLAISRKSSQSIG